LGDEATHGVADDVDLSDSELVENSSEVVGVVLDLESGVSHRGEAMATMIDHDHPSSDGEFWGDLIPLRE
jgi:hypothetical protein